MTTTTVQCPKCPKAFKNEAGLRMHDMRVHSGKVKVPGQRVAIGRPRPGRAPYVSKRVVPRAKLGNEAGLKNDAEFQNIIEQIARNYCQGPSGQMSWKVAFRDHPEWEKSLAPIAQPTWFYWGRVWKKKLAQEPQVAGSPDQPVPAQAVAVRPSISNLRSIMKNGGVTEGPIAYCPHCGEHIAMWQRVAEVVKSL